MGKSYIIEINDKYKQVVLLSADGDLYCKCVAGLTPYTEPDTEQVREDAFKNGYDAACKDIDVKSKTNAAYRKGLEDAWNAARKIVLSREDGGLFGYEERKAVFGCGNYMALKKFLAQEAIEKIRQYEQKQEKIKAGNEVNGKGGRGVITKISDDGDHFNVMWENGSTGYYMIGDFKKTGRNFPEIAEVLRKMQEEKE